MGKHVRDRTVVIPFQIFDISCVQHTADSLIHPFPHFISGQIQHQLVAAEHRFFPGNDHRPVRVRAEQIAVLIDHLRLDPDAEFHAGFIDTADQLRKRAAKLFFIRRPVAERQEITVSLSEPAVVHDQQIDAEILRLLRQADDPVSVKIKVESFPAVEQHRPHGVAVFSSADMLPDAAVQVPGQLPEAAGAEAHDHFRRGQRFAGRQRIGEFLFRQAHLHACLVILIPLGFRPEAAAVDELHGPASFGMLIRRVIGQDHHRIVLMGGHAAAAADHMRSVRQRRSFRLTLHRMPPAECDQIKITERKIQAGTLQLLDPERSLSLVCYDHASCNDIQLRQDAVEKRNLQSEAMILEKHFQRFRLILFRFGIYGRQSLQGIFPGRDLIAGVAELTAESVVRVLHDQHRAAVIAGPLHRELLRQIIQRIAADIGGIIRRSGQAPVSDRQQPVHAAGGFPSVI